MKKEMLNEFYDLAIERYLYSNKQNLKFRLNYIFDDIDLTDKKVLDVGGGTGLITFYAAANRAKKVVCLEPECAGSSNDMISQFNNFKSALSSSVTIEHLALTLQDYLKQEDDTLYDIIVLHNSINHLDEEACISFREKESSYLTYKAIFKKVYNKMSENAKLVVADCSCENFFNTLGLKCVFNPTIEWHKHQKPTTWISMLKEVGFRNPKIEWSSPNRLGKVGRVLIGNYYMAYLLQSHFKFTMDK